MHVTAGEYLVFHEFRLTLCITLANYLEQDSTEVLELSVIQSLQEEEDDVLVSQLVS